jgi:hypothetical protein
MLESAVTDPEAMKERRKHIRVSAFSPVAIAGPGHPPVSAHLKSLSEGGAAIYVRSHDTNFEQFRLFLGDEDAEAFDLRMVSRHADWSGCLIRGEFTGLNAANTDRLRALVQAWRESGGDTCGP